jgi:hypothetical protein
VTLFKQHFYYSPAHHQPKADYSAQVPENQADANKSTDSIQSQPSGKKVNYSDSSYIIIRLNPRNVGSATTPGYAWSMLLSVIPHTCSHGIRSFHANYIFEFTKSFCNIAN